MKLGRGVKALLHLIALGIGWVQLFIFAPFLYVSMWLWNIVAWAAGQMMFIHEVRQTVEEFLNDDQKDDLDVWIAATLEPQRWALKKQLKNIWGFNNKVSYFSRHRLLFLVGVGTILLVGYLYRSGTTELIVEALFGHKPAGNLEWKDVTQPLFIIFSSVILFLLWHWRDQNVREANENQRKDVNLKEFQEIQRRAVGVIDGAEYGSEAHQLLQGAALKQIVPFMLGEHGKGFIAPAIEIVRTYLEAGGEVLKERLNQTIEDYENQAEDHPDIESLDAREIKDKIFSADTIQHMRFADFFSAKLRTLHRHQALSSTTTPFSMGKKFRISTRQTRSIPWA